jgi:hypothetical protein
LPYREKNSLVTQLFPFFSPVLHVTIGSRKFFLEAVAMNIDLKVELIRRFGTQIVAAKALNIGESKLSYLVRGHVEPNPQEREILRTALGTDYFEPKGPQAA